MKGVLLPVTTVRMAGSRTPRTYRGSRRRLRRITMRGSWSAEVWLVLAWVLFLLFVVIPWMAKQDG